MDKKVTIHSPHASIFLLIIFVALLFAGILFLIWKHLALKTAMYGYISTERIWAGQVYSGADAVEDAQVFAATITHVPSTAQPLYAQKQQLQQYVSLISKLTGRDIVVMDTTHKILADTIPANDGKQFTEDHEKQIAQTLADERPRAFFERSFDYPAGLPQEVVPLKTDAGVLVGAVVMSTSNIFR